MSDTPRPVTGVFRTPSGQVFPNKTVTFFRNPRAAAAQGTSVIVDEPVATVLSGAGEISVDLVPGDYLARVALSDADRWIEVGIPDGAGGYDIEDGIEVAAGPIPSASVAQVQEMTRVTLLTKTADHTLVADDERKTIGFDSASDLTLTVPADATHDFAVGAQFSVLRLGTGLVSVAGAGGVTVNGTYGLDLVKQFSAGALFKRAANDWIFLN